MIGQLIKTLIPGLKVELDRPARRIRIHAAGGDETLTYEELAEKFAAMFGDGQPLIEAMATEPQNRSGSENGDSEGTGRGG